ncbi:DUF4190 domain-containing protein [Pseudarthrobacter chlorophenolicus]|uniref:DUF4190 domain-containing protein n=1 Tax=Pseudarthrobacter chlorophenolicus TaxID=85085 RepID=UPI000A7DE319|nr:DUF4190 domain-containing protein [Pseudarthrobacter chlorophenolicus]
MNVQTEPTHTATGELNKLSVAAIVLAVVAASGLWIFGVAVLAVFAVGAGHVALNQVRLRGQRGKLLAIAALTIGYGIATVALISILGFIPGSVQQFTQ